EAPDTSSRAMSPTAISATEKVSRPRIDRGRGGRGGRGGSGAVGGGGVDENGPYGAKAVGLGVAAADPGSVGSGCGGDHDWAEDQAAAGVADGVDVPGWPGPGAPRRSRSRRITVMPTRATAARPGLNREVKPIASETSRITPAITVSALDVLEWPRPSNASTG